MFKLPTGLPTKYSSVEEWTDYAEYTALRERQPVSLLNLVRGPLVMGDEIDVDGADDETDDFIALVDSISNQIALRKQYTNNFYPFELANRAYTIIYTPSDSNYDIIYRYLLLATRLNMSRYRIQQGIDGALLFESLCASVARNFFGENADCVAFGTSAVADGGFRARLTEVVRRMGEGGTILENPGYMPQDDSIDVIAWKGFHDGRVSKLIAFGQCKTGTSWQNNITELNTIAFCKNWFTVQLVLDPLKMFFTAQYFRNDTWRVRANKAGLVFDRFRIMNYLPEVIEEDLLNEITTWTVEAEVFRPQA